jgi:hypothetical protein
MYIKNVKKLSGMNTDNVKTDLSNSACDFMHPMDLVRDVQQTEAVSTDPQHVDMTNLEERNDIALSTNNRPLRAAKRRALMRIQDIYTWENCSEESSQFKVVAEQFDKEMIKELAHMGDEERVEIQSTIIDDLNDCQSDSCNSSDPGSLVDFIDNEENSVDSNASFLPSDDNSEDLGETESEDDSFRSDESVCSNDNTEVESFFTE